MWPHNDIENKSSSGISNRYHNMWIECYEDRTATAFNYIAAAHVFHNQDALDKWGLTSVSVATDLMLYQYFWIDMVVCSTLNSSTLINLMTTVQIRFYAILVFDCLHVLTRLHSPGSNSSEQTSRKYQTGRIQVEGADK